MKQEHELTVRAVKLLAVAALVCAAAVGARAADRFSGGSSDGYNQSEAQWTTQFPIWSPRFYGGSSDGYDAVTVQKAMRRPLGTIFIFH